MSGKSYSLHPRKSKKGKTYYVQFRNPDGSWSTARSTGESAKSRAESWVIDYLSQGDPVKNDNVTLQKFAGNDFFSYGNDWELNKRIAGKKPPSPRWCIERTELLNNHILPYFGNYRLTRIDEEVIITFRNKMITGEMGRKYSGSFTNKILFALRDILKSAYKKKLIQKIPEFELAGAVDKKRGRLTRAEATRLFAIEWDDERAYIASLIAATTGARLSEIQGLQVEDIHPDGTFTISKIWERRTKQIKHRTKNGRVREAVLPPAHLARILSYIDRHPYQSGFLLYSNKETAPASDTKLIKPLNQALYKIGISEEERKERGICFHSWRYYCNSCLVEAGLPETIIRERIGHTEESMTLRYFRGESNDSFIQAVEAAVQIPDTTH